MSRKSSSMGQCSSCLEPGLMRASCIPPVLVCSNTEVEYPWEIVPLLWVGSDGFKEREDARLDFLAPQWGTWCESPVVG